MAYLDFEQPLVELETRVRELRALSETGGHVDKELKKLEERSERLSREIDLMAEHGLRFDEATARAIGKAEARHTRSGRVALWVIALTLVYIAWKLI